MDSKILLFVNDFEFKLSALQSEMDKSDDKLKAFEKQREDIIRENNKLRALISDSEGLRADLEREQEKSRELYKKCHKFETELASNNSMEQELTEINLKLKNELSFTNLEIQKYREQLKRVGINKKK